MKKEIKVILLILIVFIGRINFLYGGVRSVGFRVFYDFYFGDSLFSVRGVIGIVIFVFRVSGVRCFIR